MINFDDVSEGHSGIGKVHVFANSAYLYIRLHQGCTDPGRKVARATKFCMLASHIKYGSRFVSALWGLEFCSISQILGTFMQAWTTRRRSSEDFNVVSHHYENLVYIVCSSNLPLLSEHLITTLNSPRINRSNPVITTSFSATPRL